MLVEHKSKGKDLDKAAQQAKDYFIGLKEHELPKYVLVSDFQRFRLYDLDTSVIHAFELKDFVSNIQLFGFIAGYEKRVYRDQDPVNIEAAERMGKLHDALKASGYTGHALEVYLVRLLFCLFADDTSIFERTQFQDYIDRHTKTDGSDLAMHLALLFQVLNTPKALRLNTLDESLDAFPYVNGKLFEEMLPFAAFNTQMREMLLFACGLDWSKISPAIFGSMFQTVMNPQERRNLGAHYTSEINIQKLIKPLFLDDLYVEFAKIKGHKPRLNEFHRKIAQLRFLDPACGCGNFLIVTYRELRDLELLVLKELYQNQLVTNIDSIINVDVDQFYGIEYDEFAVRIAEVAMWLIDHQMNLKVSHAFGQYFARLPLRKAAKIVHTNALRIDWKTIVNPNELSFILGNPPFVGAMMMNESQKKDIETVFKGEHSIGVLDYVTSWYLKAAQFIQGTPIKVAFVSTNSIAQGEQVALLWNILHGKYDIKIHFAHRTFKWSNEAKGNAAVHCVIIGFGHIDTSEKTIYNYQDIKGEPQVLKAKNINPYLVDGNHIIIQNRSQPISQVPEMRFGSMPRDGGHFILTETEKNAFLIIEPKAQKWIRPYTGAQEFINGYTRYCLWLPDIPPSELRQLPQVLKRVEKVKEFRLASKAAATRKFASIPTLFCQIAQPKTDYLAIPEVSSEKRKYIPIAFLNSDIIASNTLRLIPNATPYLFGILTSSIHMTWVKYTCGRLKSDFRYSKDIVYNNYPFPQNVTEAQKQKVTDCAHKVLEIRKLYPESSLADLYDALAMPPDLVKAHQALDKAVDLCYRPQPFGNELSRIEYLFWLYEQLNAPMFQVEKKKRK
jgi:type I restriction-modification system DNA methylase subunit